MKENIYLGEHYQRTDPNKYLKSLSEPWDRNSLYSTRHLASRWTTRSSRYSQVCRIFKSPSSPTVWIWCDSKAIALTSRSMKVRTFTPVMFWLASIAKHCWWDCLPLKPYSNTRSDALPRADLSFGHPWYSGEIEYVLGWASLASRYDGSFCGW